MENSWLSISEAAREFAASESTIRRLRGLLDAKSEVRGGRTITVVSGLACERMFYRRKETADQSLGREHGLERGFTDAGKWLATAATAGVVGGAAHDALARFADYLLWCVFRSGDKPDDLAEAIVEYDENFLPPGGTLRVYLSTVGEELVGLDGTADELLNRLYGR